MNTIIEKLKDVQIDTDKYDYKDLESSTNKDLYDGSDDEIVSKHIQHIMFDNQEEGWWIVACSGRIEGDLVIGEFLFCRRKKD